MCEIVTVQGEFARLLSTLHSSSNGTAVLLVCTYSIIDLLHDSAAPTSWMVSDY